MQSIKSKMHPSKKLPNKSDPMGIQLPSIGIEVGAEVRLLIHIFVKPFMLWRHQFEMSKHVKTSQELRLPHPATVQHHCKGVRCLCNGLTTDRVPHNLCHTRALVSLLLRH